MVRYGGGNSGLAPVSVATILESFVPVERNSTVPKKGMIYKTELNLLQDQLTS